MVLAAALRFGLRRRREERAAAASTFLPAVSVLKPMHGTEDGMERNIERFSSRTIRSSKLLFCARQESDAGLVLARKVGERYPGVDAKYVTCGEPTPQFHNAKVFSLEKLDSVARHRLLHYERCRCESDGGLSAEDGAEPEGPEGLAGFERVPGDRASWAEAGLHRSWTPWGRAWR